MAESNCDARGLPSMVHAEVTFFVPPSDMRAPLAASEGLRVATRSRGPVTSIHSVSAGMRIGWSKARRQKVTGPEWPDGLLTGVQPPTNRRPADPSVVRSVTQKRWFLNHAGFSAVRPDESGHYKRVGQSLPRRFLCRG